MARTTDSAAAATPDAPSATGGVPPLENGDRLTRPEFERRFDAMPNLKIAELIEGVVYIPNTGSALNHGCPCAALIGWLGQYRAATPGVEGGAHAHGRLDWDNMPQPDALLMIASDSGGQAHIDEDDYVSGAPELIAEVAASSVSYDLHVKRHVYRRSGAREYIVWRVLDQAIDWFVLREDLYQPLSLDADDRYKSEVLPGLWLDPAALVRGDLLSAVQALQQGLSSPEHAAFVARLQRAEE